MISHATINLADFNFATDGSQAEAVNNGNKWQSALAAGAAYTFVDYVWPAGEIVIADVHAPETVAWDDAAIKIGRSGIRMRSVSPYATVLRSANNDGASVIEVGRDASPAFGVVGIAVSDFRLEGLILDNNRLNQPTPPEGEGGWSPLVIAEYCSDIHVSKVHLLNGVRYGARVGGRGVSRVTFDEFRCDNSWSDGVDVKSFNGTNHDIHLTRGLVTNWGQRNNGSVSAAYDIRSGCTVSHSYAVGGGRGTSDRDHFRAQDGTEGDLNNVTRPVHYIDCHALGDDPWAYFTVGFRISGPRVSLTGCTGRFNGRGLWHTGNFTNVMGLTLYGAKDGAIFGLGSRATFHGLKVSDARRNAAVFESGASDMTFFGAHFDSRDKGVTYNQGAGSVDYYDFNSTAVNGSAIYMPGFTGLVRSSAMLNLWS